MLQRPDGEEQIKHVRKIKGCFEVFDEPKIEIDGYGFYSCLCHPDFQFDGFNDLIHMYKMFNKGVLPFEGCLVDQPNQVLEYFQMLDILYKELEDSKKNQADNTGK